MVGMLHIAHPQPDTRCSAHPTSPRDHGTGYLHDKRDPHREEIGCCIQQRAKFLLPLPSTTAKPISVRGLTGYRNPCASR